MSKLTELTQKEFDALSRDELRKAVGEHYRETRLLQKVGDYLVSTIPTDTAIVAAFQALPDDAYAESRERAINSLRMRDLTDDYDQVRAAGDLGGAEIDLREMRL